MPEERDMHDEPSTDSSRLISISSPDEIKHWCETLGCTEVQLAEAIALCGYGVDSVRAFLANPSLKASSPRPWQFG
jgi:Protein of unknown function (DUF3606)